jgi:hypothetical protein
MMEKTFKIRSYGRMELAQLYCPDIQPRSAWKKLKSWIDYYPHLNDTLASLGKTSATRIFSPPQVRAIVEALGEP